MNTEELKEMIEATITTNGRKEITKDAFVCALIAIVNAI